MTPMTLVSKHVIVNVCMHGDAFHTYKDWADAQRVIDVAASALFLKLLSCSVAPAGQTTVNGGCAQSPVTLRGVLVC